MTNLPNTTLRPYNEELGRLVVFCEVNKRTWTTEVSAADATISGRRCPRERQPNHRRCPLLGEPGM